MSGMMPLIDTLSYGSQEYHSSSPTGRMTQRQANVLAVVVIGPYALAAAAVVPGTTYFSLARKGRWAVNQLMRPRVVMSINAAVERNEIASMIRGEPQTISVRPHFVVFRNWRWTAWTGFGGVPMLFPWFDIHPKDPKSAKSSSEARRGNAVGPGGGTKKKPSSISLTRKAPWISRPRCRKRNRSGKLCRLGRGHRGRHQFK